VLIEALISKNTCRVVETFVSTLSTTSAAGAAAIGEGVQVPGSGIKSLGHRLDTAWTPLGHRLGAAWAPLGHLWLGLLAKVLPVDGHLRKTSWLGWAEGFDELMVLPMMLSDNVDQI
jgi:hypothetical protein